MTNPVWTEVQSFFKELDQLKYPQTVVSDVAVVGATDLNAWRKRKLIHANEWEKDGRVVFTGRGLLHACIVGRLAWIVGPSRASDIAWALYPTFDELKQLTSDDDAFAKKAKELANKMIVMNRPLGSYESAKPRMIVGNDEVWEYRGGLPWWLEDRDKLNIADFGDTKVLFPVGSLSIQWALGARYRIA